MSKPVEQFIETFAASLRDGTFVRLTLSQALPGGVRPQRILGRLIELRGQSHLSLTLRHQTKDITRNVSAGEAAGWLRGQLSSEFRSATLGTTQQDWQLIIPREGEPRLIPHKPSTPTAPARQHDQPHEQTLDATARDWLHGLGVTDANGKVNPAMADKHRQINRYLELLTHLANDCGWVASEGRATRVPLVGGPTQEDGDSRSSSLRSAAELTFADMGCGKGYLTFGAWQLFNRQLGVPARVLGVEARTELVETTNALATKIGAKTLSFTRGEIATAELPRLDALIALHACNTATDDAIRRGIELGARLIIVAPCCHKELRPQLGKPEPLAAVLRHGIMEERFAEWLTDGLRALFLEWAGYRTKLMEFVSTEHTPKNLMLAAVREREPFTDEALRGRIVELKQFFDIERHALDPLLVAADVRRLTSTAEKS